MTPIDYQIVGEEDYALHIHIDTDGHYSVESGTYATEPPRAGVLDADRQRQLLDALRALGIPREHAAPEGAADAFEARLTVGAPGAEAVYEFWAGALEEDAELNRFIRLLETI